MLQVLGFLPKGGYSFTPGKIDMNIQRRLLYGLASMAAWYAGAGHALGLGELTLQSALHQPLQAIIQLHDSEGLSPAEVVVALADAEAFSQMGLERPFALTDLRFTPVIEDRKLVIRVESVGPVKEPYLNFLVQLKRASGSLLREYTVLLDPPLYQPTPVMASSLGARAAPAASPGDAARSTAIATTARRPSPAPPQPGSERYQTVPGDSLWAIASATRADARVSVKQQMDAIGALNQHAFVNGDLSRLRVGQVLTLPAVSKASPALEENYQQTVVEPVQPTPELPSAELPGSDRLRIDDPEELQLSEEELQLHERLMNIEKRLMGLLGELELRDAQIADAKANLEKVQRMPDAEPFALAVSDAASAVTEQGVDLPGAGESHAGRNEVEEQRRGWLVGWWPLPTALLMALLGALFLRSRRQDEAQALPQVMTTPLPRPVTVPGHRVVDPLEGVELYLVYGRLPEARVMLEKAILAEPQRLDLRLRLISILAELGDLEGFARQEQKVRELGAEQEQIDQVKARHPGLFVSPFSGQAPGGWVEEEIELGLDSLDPEHDWDMPDEDGERGNDRQLGQRRR